MQRFKSVLFVLASLSAVVVIAVTIFLCFAYADRVQRFESDATRKLRIRVTLDHVVGYVLGRDGEVSATSQLVVWLRKDADGIYVSSAYPELPR